jgi:CHASE3 domain sensor protein
MKNSTILIVAGIIIMIVGGIVFVNNTQAEDSIAHPKTSVGKVREALGIAKNYDSQPTILLNNPMILIIGGGMIMVLIGAYGFLRTPSTEK